MDPYIIPEALDALHPLQAIKLANYQLAAKEYAARAVELKSLPSKIILQTTDLCNLACPMCQIPVSRKRHSMPVEIFDDLIEQLFPTLIELHPTNVGEPLVSPWFGYMCDKMLQFGVLLDLTTNGTLLKDKMIEKIAPIARDIKISFDGATPETFEKIRLHANFKTVCDNIRKLRKALDVHITKRPIVLALQMTLMQSNFLELPDLIRLASKLGVDRVKAYHLFVFSPEMEKESLMHNLEVWDPVLDEALKLGKLYGVDLQLAEPLLTVEKTTIDLEPVVCHLPWHESWVDFDGSVYACHSHGGENAGNVLHQSFRSIWNSDLYQQIRFNFSQRKPKNHCYACGMNHRKQEEHQPVVYDPDSFLKTKTTGQQKLTRWSSRMKQFDLNGRKNR
jgi:radical SAM protein with 4Fe4S-binding SPASM domain